MDVQVGDVLTMKKPHPCGAKQWKVLRTGMDFKLKCQGCGHEVMLPRSKAEKNIKLIEREGKPVSWQNLDKICALLKCQPGDLLEWVDADELEEI